MTTESIEIGTEYLININTLKEVGKICTAYGWQKLEEFKGFKNQLSLLGTDYGKPNASETMTHISKGNREMFYEIEKLVTKRISELEKEFKTL